MDEVKKITDFSKRIRKNILDTALEAGANSSHFGGALSTVDILATLYESILNHDPQNPLWEERDRFILSKGHGCLGYYSTLHEKGYFSKSDLNSFEKNGSFLLGHPVINKKKGIEFSNGSLGMGLSIGIGLSIASKKSNKNFKVFVLMGDGECNEGSVWEASMAAPNFKLDNLTAIIDNNTFQQTGSNKDIMSSDDLSKKWQSFNWEVLDVNGHDIGEILEAFKYKSNKPKMIIAKTIKGKGFSFAENNNDWHHKIMTKNQYDQAIKEIDG